MSRAVWIVGFLPACAPVAPAPPPPPPDPGETRVVTDTTSRLPPPGYGSLHQDEFSVELRDVDLNVKVTPLAERVIRLAAPDTYDRLHALAMSRGEQAQRIADGRDVELFLVSFFSRDPNIAYRPDELRLSHRGRTLQPDGIVPLTTGWGRQLLQPEETQSAIYVFSPGMDYELPIVVRYGVQESDDWHRLILPRLEQERTRVESRAGTRHRRSRGSVP
jgi:hypothetical protein